MPVADPVESACPGSVILVLEPRFEDRVDLETTRSAGVGAFASSAGVSGASRTR